MWVSGNGAQDVADLQSLPFMEELLIWSGVGAIAFLTGVNGVSVSSISREGKQFALSKSLPVSPGQQVLAKWLLAMVFTLFVIGVVVAMQMLVGGGAWVLLWTLLLGSAAGAGMAGVGIVVNLMIPRLDWNTPGWGANGLLMMMIQMVVAGLVALIVFLMKWLDVPDSLVRKHFSVVIGWQLRSVSGSRFPGRGKVSENRGVNENGPLGPFFCAAGSITPTDWAKMDIESSKRNLLFHEVIFDEHKPMVRGHLSVVGE